MTSRFLAKVLYTAQRHDGAFERKIEQLVFEALTYTDCEAAIYKYMESVTRAEFTIMKIDRFQVDSMVGEMVGYCDKFFVVKQEFMSIDDVIIKEKVLVIAQSMDAAKSVLIEKNNRWNNAHPEIKSIVETKITDYIYAETDQN